MSNDRILDPATYAQPDALFETSSQTVESGDVFVGDIVKGRKVAERKAGTKWVYLRDADGKLISELPIGSQVEVERVTQTKESDIAQYRARKNRSLAEKLAHRTDKVQSALAQVTEQINQYGSADYTAISNLLAAQAELKVNNELVGMASTEKHGDLFEACKAFADRLADRLVKDTLHRGLSRSTSVVSNLLEDVDREAMARFIDDARWLGF